MESEDQEKKPYSPPILTKLTPEQARKLVADRKYCSEEEAAEFLKFPPTTTAEQRHGRSAAG
jgi:hypothetical protein